MNYSKLLIAIALILFLFLSSCTGTEDPLQDEPVAATPFVAVQNEYTVQRGEIIEQVELLGRVSPSVSHDLFFGISGTVSEVYFEEGDMVNEGDVIAILRGIDDISKNINAAEREVLLAQQQFDNILLDIPIWVAQAEYDHKLAEKELEEASLAQNDLGYQHVTDDLTLQQLQNALSDALVVYNQAKTDYDKVADQDDSSTAKRDALNRFIAARTGYYRALANYNWAMGVPDEQEIGLVNSAYELALAKQQKAQFLVEYWATPEETIEYQLAELAVRDAEEKLLGLEKERLNYQIISPIDGILLQINLEPGRLVEAYQTVCVSGDTSTLVITASATPAKLEKMGINQEVNIRFTSASQDEFAGIISSLPLLSETGGYEGNGNVLFELDDPERELILGEAVIIEVIVNTKSDVLWLPPTAIRTFQGQEFVYIKEDGYDFRVNIITGLGTSSQVEIVSGLDEGQVVVGE